MKMSILRRLPLIRPFVSASIAPKISSFRTQIRFLHPTRPPPKIPKPRPFVPNVEAFLKLIGRDLARQASKFPTWDSLFSMTSLQLKELGVQPPRTRRYLLQWIQRYRNGALGPGGDFEFVQDGKAYLRVAIPPAGSTSNARWVINVPQGEGVNMATASKTYPRPKGYTVRGLKTIAGSHAVQLPGRVNAVVQITEGMWELKRGRKVDGGERRRDEVRFKRRVAERRALRESELAKQV